LKIRGSTSSNKVTRKSNRSIQPSSLLPLSFKLCLNLLRKQNRYLMIPPQILRLYQQFDTLLRSHRCSMIARRKKKWRESCSSSLSKFQAQSLKGSHLLSLPSCFLNLMKSMQLLVLNRLRYHRSTKTRTLVLIEVSVQMSHLSLSHLNAPSFKWNNTAQAKMKWLNKQLLTTRHLLSQTRLLMKLNEKSVLKGKSRK